MDSIKAFFASLYVVALSAWVFPALALAQGANTGRAPATGGAAAPASTPGADTGGGGAGWLWIVAALVVLAIIWWAMSTRRRGTVAR